MGSFRSISRPADFKAAFVEGRRSGDRGLTVYVRQTGERGTRLGLVVRAPSSVLRNRIKRRLREAVRAAGPEDGVDVVVRADARVAREGFQEMVDTIRRAMRGTPA
ncbi:MAG: ribonuclease P protein component [Actinomycetota bacterium]